MTAWHTLRRRLRALPANAVFLVVLAGSALVVQDLWPAAFVLSLIGLAFAGQWSIRRRSRRLNSEASATGGGVWFGRMPCEQAEDLWAQRLPFLFGFSYVADGCPVPWSLTRSG